MSHEIEADFVSDWYDELTQCRNCNSFEERNGSSFCREAQSTVSASGHCDFFQAQD